MKKTYPYFFRLFTCAFFSLCINQLHAQIDHGIDTAYWRSKIDSLYAMRQTDLEGAQHSVEEISRVTKTRHPHLYALAQCENAFLLGKNREVDEALLALQTYLPQIQSSIPKARLLRYQNYLLVLRLLRYPVDITEILTNRSEIILLDPESTPHYFSIRWRANRMVSDYYFSEGLWTKALEYMMDNLTLIDQDSSLRKHEAAELYNIGCAFFYTKVFDQAELFFYRAWDASCKQGNTPDMLDIAARSMHYIGIIYQDQGNDEAWKKLTENSAAVFTELESSSVISPLLDLSEYYIEQQEFETARQYLRDAQRWMDEKEALSPYHQASIFATQAIFAHGTGKHDEAVYWAERAYETDTNAESRLVILQKLAVYYAAAGKFENAYRRLEEYHNLYATGVNEAQIKENNASQQSLAIREKDKEAFLLQQESKMKDLRLEAQRSIISWGVFGFLIVSALAFYLFRLWQQLGTTNQLLNEQTRQAQLARESAEQAMRARAEFLSVMSHEIRTPMNGVIGMADLLSSTELNEEQRSFLRTIHVSAESLMTIINDILDFSKIESGKLEIEQEPFSLRTAVEDVLDLFSGKASEAGLDLAYDIDPNLPPMITGDSVRLKQVLSNLVNNALKFTPTGHVLVRVHMPAVPTAQESPFELQIEVQDTGIGIPLSRQHKLFKAFSQTDASTTRKYGGTGLGLAISARLTEAMGGKIWVESEENKGSAFCFTIQTKRATGEGIHEPFSAPEIVKGKCVLIVDDNAAMRETLSKQLGLWGMRTLEVESAQAGLQALQAHPDIDLILADMLMPGMNGLTFYEAVFDKWGQNRYPTIIMNTSGTPTPGTRLHQTLSKPVKREALARAFASALGQPLSRQLTPAHSINVLDKDFASLHPQSILVAEDNLINQKLILNSLKKLGYESVELAHNGEEAVEKAMNQSFDLIFMDVQMPVLDGLAATKKIRSNLSEEQQPVIISMTASAMPEDQEACRMAGMQDQLSKPFRTNQLKNILEKYAIFAKTTATTTEVL